MASGINGPGANNKISQDSFKIDIPEDEDSPKPVSQQMPVDSEMPYLPTASAAPSGGHEHIPAVTISEPTDGHLSFANLMSIQNRDLFEPESAIRRSSSASATPHEMQSQFGAYGKKPSSLVEDIDKVFDTGNAKDKPYAEPPKLQLDFGDPNIASEVSSYNEQRFNDADYSSHRRSQKHHPKPLVGHLSSHELKSVKSRAAALPGGEKEKKKSSRRRHRSSSSSSSHGGTSKSSSRGNDVLPTERKIKKKEKKKKAAVRKSLTANVRQRTLSIPEEEEGDEEFMKGLDEDLVEEDESEEEEEEEEEEELARDSDDNSEERPDDDKGGDSSFRRHSEGDDGDSANKDKEVTSHDGKAGGVMDIGKEKMMAKFSVGDDDEPKMDRLTVPSIMPPQPPEDSSTDKKPFYVGSSEDVTKKEKKDKNKERVDSPKTAERERKRRRHSHQKKSRHLDSISHRRASGQQLRNLDEARQRKTRSKLSSEDDEKVNVDDLRRHRFEDHAGIRKHLLHRPVKRRRSKPAADLVTKTDRKPHEVFVELDELVSGEWKETARWIKFEEDVEESQRWGKPRVASLSFHSLLELRRTIEKGAVVLDLHSDNLTDIANTVVENMVQSDQIRSEDRGSVLRVLLSKHKHLPGQTGLAYSLSQANFSSFFAASTTGISKMAIDEDETSMSYTNTVPLLDFESTDVERGRTGSMSKAASPSTKDFKIMKKIPHDAEATAVLVGSVEDLEQPTMAFVRLATGVDLDDVVALPIPVRFIFVLLGPSKEDFDYHEIGRSISTLMSDEEFHVVAYQADTRGDLLRAINEFLDDSIVLPPGQLENPELLKNIARYQKNIAQREKKKQLKAISEKGSPVPPPVDPLRRTRKCFGGLIRDVKRRYPKYWSDIKDGINAQCLASFIFIYFAALSPAITFGGLLGEKTNGLMGVSEMVVGCCLCGCMMALFSGQPMLIVGATGPLLVFEEAVYGFCLGNGLPFLATRVWIGLWISIIAILTVAYEGSFLIKFVSRFTQEIFAALISMIFIYETFFKLFKIFQEHPLMETYPVTAEYLNETGWNCSLVEEEYMNVTNGTSGPMPVPKVLNQPNTALLSTLLMFGTYLVAMRLREFRNSKFLRSSVRRTIGDFGVPIAIFIMVLVDYLIKDTYTQKLNIPSGISPTDPTQRGWLISPLGEAGNPMPVWMIFASALPAFLVFILIFMESHITELIVSKKERCLKKGTGFHLNILVLGLLNALVSFFGLPWVCAAAVRSITHTNSLTVMSKTQAPGEKPKIEATLEQRVTCFAVNAALGLSILMQPILKEIPIAVLFGIFLYMGVTSLAGVEFIDRIELLFMPSKHYPDYSYVKVVRPYRIHIFTIIEFVCLVILWIVKSTDASIAFPFFLLLTIPLRRIVLPKIFKEKELSELDNDGSSGVEPNDDFDEGVLRPD